MPAVGSGGNPANYATPSDNEFVICSPFSGPSRSPFDAKKPVAARTYTGGVMDVEADITNYSTGALSTGIGIGTVNRIASGGILASGWTDDVTPGISYNTSATTLQTAADARLTCIGGGRSALVSGTGPNGNGYPASETVSVPNPYNAQPIVGFGTGVLGTPGGARDAGAGPAFTGFPLKMVTASGTVANNAAIETNTLNRTGISITNGFSVFGQSTVASAAVA